MGMNRIRWKLDEVKRERKEVYAHTNGMVIVLCVSKRTRRHKNEKKKKINMTPWMGETNIITQWSLRYFVRVFIISDTEFPYFLFWWRKKYTPDDENLIFFSFILKCLYFDWSPGKIVDRILILRIYLPRKLCEFVRWSISNVVLFENGSVDANANTHIHYIMLSLCMKNKLQPGINKSNVTRISNTIVGICGWVFNFRAW